jgi:hypothetical protein
MQASTVDINHNVNEAVNSKKKMNASISQQGAFYFVWSVVTVTMILRIPP